MRSAIFLAAGLALALTGCQDETKAPVTPPPPPVTTTTTVAPTTPAPTTPAGVPKTVEAAIQRYERYLHGLGKQDLDTVCDIAGPAAKQAERQGFGTCRQTFPITFQMIPAAKRKALETATVDPKLVRQKANGDVDVPVKAVRSSTTFAEQELGSVVLSYRDGNWFIID
ncbi:hypothetical protein NLX83_27965 [Allokutzneria sp. A3M-2-11 16]|uniref:hypothetical protein n=1 Tax=Allokutzneria sp. A3M-2-11 16 TaxID=2962043 RepID=UPI0020B6D657|nr:hypothetical protein [Allokutzneria sp. A3M-2-11 16]MCP3803119.1 hypothetical protein [Allokutzneria sp. A3M-2-11 16]